MKYRYYINFNKASPSWSEFWPTKEAICTKFIPSGVEFYREKCSELIINRKCGDDDNSTVYDTLETWVTDKTKFNDEIEIEIYRGDRTGTLYFAGYFSISDSTIDKEYKVFKITPLIDDAYRDFVDGGEAEYNVFANSIFSEDIIIGSYDALGVWTAGSPNGTFNDFDTFTGTGGTLTSVIDSDAGNVEARYQTLGNLTNNKKVIVKIIGITLNAGTGPYIDIFSAADASITDEGAQQITAAKNIEFTINSTEEGFIVLHTDPALQLTNFALSLAVIKEGDLELNYTALFMDFIEKFITHSSLMNLTGYVGKIKSTFINNDALPSDAPSSINTFITANADGNYVSELTVNVLNGFLIGETRRFVTASVTENLVSFNQIMSDLMETLQAGWYIDADGDFRIEHIKYFEKLTDDSTAVDLTGAGYTKYKPESDKKELKFNKSLLANREQFRWAQTDTLTNSEDFIGVDIIYDNLETISNVAKHEPRNITTDLQYLVDNPDDASASGFIYLSGTVLDSGYYFIDFVLGELSATRILNGIFAWANLQDRYWTWRRMSENGDMNSGGTTSFDSAVRFLEQSDVKFGYQSTLSGFTKITTSQGTGRQLEAKRDLDTDFITLLIAYNPYE